MKPTDAHVKNADIALLTDHRYEGKAHPSDWYHSQILEDDRLLAEALMKRGFSSIRLDWARQDTDWSKFRALVIRTTWDYFDRFPEFSKWLERVKEQCVLINPPDALEWNLHKHYLKDLEHKGIPIVPLIMLEKGSNPDIGNLLRETGWREAVIKPAVSGAARLTYRLNSRNTAKVQQLLSSFMAQEDFLIQPFMENITGVGEDSLMVFGGRCTHAVRKRAKPGDFRVQDDHGGTVHEYQAEPGQITLALHAMKAGGFDLAYGRVDMVKDEKGRDRVMELEIIEPELWLRFHPESAGVFADEIVHVIES